MRRQQDVARAGGDARNAGAEGGERGGVVGKAVILARHRGQAVGVDNRAAHPAVATVPPPTERARGVAGGGHRRQQQIAEPHRVAVADNPPDGGGGERRVHPRLRIVGAGGATGEHLCRRGRGDQCGAGQLLQPGDAADMIGMLVAVEDEPDVAQLDAELADIVGDQVGGIVGPAIDQHVAVVAGDQDHRNAAGADEVGVGVDPHRRGRLVPLIPIAARRRPGRPGLTDRGFRRRVVMRRAAERDGDLHRHQRGDQPELNGHSSPR